MLEKFYFETFLIAFSAFIGAFVSYFIGWTIERSKINNQRKIIFLLSLFIFTMLVSALVLFLVIYLIGWLAIF